MTLTDRIRHEDGFTLMEVLAVCVVVGILAAIALPSFAGRDAVATDAEAKANVRNLFGHVQSCFVEREDYTLCDEPSELGSPAGFSWGTGAGQVEIRRNGNRTTKTQVTIRGTSKSVTDGTRHRFTFVKRTGPPPDSRTCESGNAGRAGGCNNGTW